MLTLYSYCRSTAAYRVRIALNLKAIPHRLAYVNLLQGEEQQQAYRDINPQRLVPALDHDGRILTQSMAILEYLEETFPERPLLPADPALRAAARELCNVIACDIHPLNNLRVLKYLENELGADQDSRLRWYRHWVVDGFTAIEQRLADAAGDFAGGDAPGLADALLVAQMFNARRFSIDTADFPTIERIEGRCLALEPFAEAAPENQADAS